MMKEIRFHGRGGQGTVVATILLAKALFKAGYHIQTFPFFGVERRGAPVEAYVRFGEGKIFIRSNVYDPDMVVVLDRGLAGRVDVTRGLKSGGALLLNTGDPCEFFSSLSGYDSAWVDADRIAVELGLGTRTHPMINTAMVGAFAKLAGTPSISMIEEVISSEIHQKTQENIEAARSAYEQVQRITRNKCDG
jgi:pyruvate ferredoxin oxidoreductase gamma subunit/2-oxoisovalerate ferredoxin oxidoreductase gamma subunit